MIETNGVNHVNGKGAPGTSGAPPHRPKQAPLTCPTCKAPVTEAVYDQIMRLDEAREAKLAEDRAALARERELLDRKREEIAAQGAAEESARWEVEAQRAAREMTRLRKEVVAVGKRAKATEKKQREDEARRRVASEQKAAQALAKVRAALAAAQAKAEADKYAAEAKAQAAAAALAREAKREAEEAQRKTVEALRAELRATEQRRQREGDAMKREITSLQRKAEAQREHAGNFGIEGEQGLVEVLRSEFPADRIEHHGKGGDVVQHVVDGGTVVAKIVFEVKNVRTWQESAFLRQARAAMAKHETSYGVLVSRVMPPRRAGMCVIDGVIVTVPAVAAHVVSVMREGIVAVARVEASERGAKTAALVKYLRGDEFSSSMRRVAVVVGELQKGLARERSLHTGWWSTREANYSSVIREVCGIGVRVRELLAGGPANDNGKPVEKVR